MQHDEHRDLSKVDRNFEPYEPYRPVPLLLIAVACSLAIWGALTYVDNLTTAEQFVSRIAPISAEPVTPAAELAEGLGNASPETLTLIQAGRDHIWSCASCHGAAGEGTATTPRLAGQLSDYLFKQLVDFRDGTRDNAHMVYVAKALGDDEMHELADYYAQIRLPSRVGPRLDGDLERGRQITHEGDWKRNVPACVQCHGSGAEGVKPSFPVLAGQQPEYTFSQLAQWHAGTRGNSPQQLMDRISQAMTPEDMRAVADYLATLPLDGAPASQIQ
ncbi:cytochrome c [Halopseudomonas bauzanensis]|uniref:c-type cytochrome n=1 Tax=Halopseudomonas bauzanensis TaxID=653930 RepID=UPI00352603FA